MPSNQDPANSSSPPQSIPLRDLTRPPDSADLGDGGRRHTRGRSLLGGGALHPMSSTNFGTGYERLEDHSPSPAQRPHRAGGQGPLSISPSARHGDEIDTPTSPVGHPAEFQAAMGFAGLNVPDISLSHAPRERSMSYESETYADITPLTPYSHPYGDLGDADASYFSADSDRVPLTDPNHLQPMSGAQPSTPNG